MEEGRGRERKRGEYEILARVCMLDKSAKAKEGEEGGSTSKMR